MLEKKDNSAADLEEGDHLGCKPSDSDVGGKVGFHPGRDIPIIPGFDDTESLFHGSDSCNSLPRSVVTDNKTTRFDCHENAKNEAQSLNYVNNAYAKQVNNECKAQEANNNDRNHDGGRATISANKEDGGRNEEKEVHIALSQSQHSSDDYMLVPPDGGWGWLVLAGSMLVNVLVPGMVKSFGVLFVEFLEVFDATLVEASWIPALCYFLYSSLGPVASILSNKFSFRTVTILGGVSASVGMMLSYFADSITYLYISYGLLFGMGAGLAFPPGVFIVATYFDRRRGLANGLCISGSAIGSIILPPFLRYLLSEYGYRGAVLLMGGITLHVCVGALFYHPVQRHMKKVSKEPEEDAEEQDDRIASPAMKIMEHVPSRKSSINNCPNQSLPISIPSAEKKVLWYLGKSPEQDSIVASIPEDERWYLAQSSSFMGPSIDKSSVENLSPLAVQFQREELQNVEGRDRSQVVVVSNEAEGTESLLQSRLNLKVVPSETKLSGKPKKVDWDFFNTLPPAKQRLLRMSLQQPSNQKISRTFSSASNMSNSSFRYVSSVHHGNTFTTLQHTASVPEFASTLTIRSVNRTVSWFSACWSKVKSSSIFCKEKQKSPEKKKLFDLSLLTDSLYLIILISNSTNAIGYTNFVILLPAYAKSMGFDKSKASLLLSFVAGADLVGRIGGSALSDLQLMPRKYYYIGGLAVSGVTLALLPIAQTYYELIVCCIIFGLSSGTYVGITAVIMADMLGIERLASSFGISLFVNGILQLFGPPICGLLLQELESYVPIFSTLGVTLLCGAAIWVFIPIIERKRESEELMKAHQNGAEENLL